MTRAMRNTISKAGHLLVICTMFVMLSGWGQSAELETVLALISANGVCPDLDLSDKLTPPPRC